MNSEEKQILESRQSRAVIATAATRIAGALRVPEGNHCTSHSDRPLATSVTAPDPARVQHSGWKGLCLGRICSTERSGTQLQSKQGSQTKHEWLAAIAYRWLETFCC